MGWTGGGGGKGACRGALHALTFSACCVVGLWVYCVLAEAVVVLYLSLPWRVGSGCVSPSSRSCPLPSSLTAPSRFVSQYSTSRLISLSSTLIWKRPLSVRRLLCRAMLSVCLLTGSRPITSSALFAADRSASSAGPASSSAAAAAADPSSSSSPPPVSAAAGPSPASSSSAAAATSSLDDWLRTNGLTQAEIDDVSSLLSAIGVSSHVTPNWCDGEASDEEPPTEESVKTALLAVAGRTQFDKAHSQLVARGLPYLVAALKKAWSNERERLTGMCVCGAARAGSWVRGTGAVAATLLWSPPACL